MDWIKELLPLIGVAIGWFLSEKGKILNDKRQDKRKLRKLLYFLLELRFHFTKEHSFELGLDKVIDLYKNKLVEKFKIDKNDPQIDLVFNSLKPVVEQLISKHLVQDDKYGYLKKDIDKMLVELAEIFPIMAYELNGRQNIKERLESVNKYIGDFQSLANEMPFDLKKWISPKFTNDLLIELDESIKKIASQIDKQTLNESINKIAKMEFHFDVDEANTFVDEIISKISDTISKQ